MTSKPKTVEPIGYTTQQQIALLYKGETAELRGTTGGVSLPVPLFGHEAILAAYEQGKRDAVPAVQVKPLVWEDDPYGRETSKISVSGLYRIHHGGDKWYFNQTLMGTGGKAAAQADYEARILSALEAPL